MTASAEQPTLSPELLIRAYSQGFFPMHHPEAGMQWHWPEMRAVVPLDRVRKSKRTHKLLADPKWKVTRDTCFAEVIQACADRSSTWIDQEIIKTYTELHQLGYAHSVEVWVEQELAGGLYGVSLHGAFFGESMFNRVDHSAKVAFHHLVDHLRERKFKLLDSQYLNEFTQSLGAVEITKERFHEVLADALIAPVQW